MHDLAQDPMLWTKEDTRLDLRVGERVSVGSKCGTVTALAEDPMYPVAVALEGETREVRPIFHSIRKAR